MSTISSHLKHKPAIDKSALFDNDDKAQQQEMNTETINLMDNENDQNQAKTTGNLLVGPKKLTREDYYNNQDDDNDDTKNQEINNEQSNTKKALFSESDSGESSDFNLEEETNEKEVKVIAYSKTKKTNEESKQSTIATPSLGASVPPLEGNSTVSDRNKRPSFIDSAEIANSLFADVIGFHKGEQARRASFTAARLIEEKRKSRVKEQEKKKSDDQHDAATPIQENLNSSAKEQETKKSNDQHDANDKNLHQEEKPDSSFPENLSIFEEHGKRRISFDARKLPAKNVQKSKISTNEKKKLLFGDDAEDTDPLFKKEFRQNKIVFQEEKKEEPPAEEPKAEDDDQAKREEERKKRDEERKKEREAKRAAERLARQERLKKMEAIAKADEDEITRLEEEKKKADAKVAEEFKKIVERIKAEEEEKKKAEGDK